MSTWAAPPPPHGPGVDEEAQTRKGRQFVIAGLITSTASLLLCPCVGSVAGGALALAGQQTTPARRRSTLGRLPLLTYVLSVVGLVGWMTIFAVGGATEPQEDKVASDAAPSTTTVVSVPNTEPAAAAPTLPVPAGDAELLAALGAVPEQDPGGYNRDMFNYPEGGTDSRGCNTRARVLERDSTVPAQISFPGCQVLAGRWVDSYTGAVYENPADVSIDHLVALKEAYVSGAFSWSPATRMAFANDVERAGALRVIGGPGNTAKSEKDPAEWKPPLDSAWADYAQAWASVKVAYGLTADQAEADALRTMLLPPPPPPPPPPPAPAPAPATVAPATTRPATTRAATTRPVTTRPVTTRASSCHSSYRGQCVTANASDVDCAGGRGDGPEYTGRVEVVGPDVYGLDGNGDGIGCENS